jgi:hypothetical protein
MNMDEGVVVVEEQRLLRGFKRWCVLLRGLMLGQQCEART